MYLEQIRTAEEEWKERHKDEISQAEAANAACEDGIPLKVLYTPADSKADFYAAHSPRRRWAGFLATFRRPSRRITSLAADGRAKGRHTATPVYSRTKITFTALASTRTVSPFFTPRSARVSSVMTEVMSIGPSTLTLT